MTIRDFDAEVVAALEARRAQWAAQGLDVAPIDAKIRAYKGEDGPPMQAPDVELKTPGPTERVVPQKPSAAGRRRPHRKRA